MIKKADVILGISILAVGLIAFVLSLSMASGSNDYQKVTVTIDGELYGEYAYPSAQSKTIEINKNNMANTIVIDKQGVYMKDANCKGGDCVMMHSINKQGQTIVCLPHKLVVEITGGVINADTYTY